MNRFQLILLISCCSCCIWNGIDFKEYRLVTVGIGILIVLVVEFYNEFKNSNKNEKSN